MTTTEFKFKKVRSVTLQLFKWKNDVERYFKLTSPMYQGQQLPAKDGKAQQDPVTLINCIDLETGEEGQFIAGFVLVETFNRDEAYMNDQYVGKCFAITQKRDTSKTYNTYQIVEIEVDETPNAKKSKSDD